MDSRRKELLKVRDAIPKEQRELFSKNICCAIINSDEYKSARNVMCYKAFGSEVDLAFLIEHALNNGKKVLLPVCNKDSHTMTAHFYDGTAVKGAYGIDEPIGDEGVPDVVICPMLAFNKDGYRIGYGAGYYDKYLTKLSKIKQDTVLLGAAFSVQLADFTPQSHDVPLSRIYTQEEIFQPKGIFQ